ncbi:MAG: hypothetical protein ABSG49_10160 [Methanoregula sp.]|uniref:hypothetical protein n=1 Tax=Methanoregula sp. TaxID=2052170 RepID=UPI003C1B40EA
MQSDFDLPVEFSRRLVRTVCGRLAGGAPAHSFDGGIARDGLRITLPVTGMARGS